jgi:hypothetical protein
VGRVVLVLVLQRIERRLAQGGRDLRGFTDLPQCRLDPSSPDTANTTTGRERERKPQLDCSKS